MWRIAENERNRKFKAEWKCQPESSKWWTHSSLRRERGERYRLASLMGPPTSLNINLVNVNYRCLRLARTTGNIWRALGLVSSGASRGQLVGRDQCIAPRLPAPSREVSVKMSAEQKWRHCLRVRWSALLPVFPSYICFVLFSPRCSYFNRSINHLAKLVGKYLIIKSKRRRVPLKPYL